MSTGAALCALAGLVSAELVRGSLDYLSAEAQRVRTPLSVGWGLLGLRAWNAIPADAGGWVVESLERQSRYGEFGTSQLAFLIAAHPGNAGLAGILPPEES